MNDEKTREDNDEVYISGSKKNIDKFINKNDYMRAFGLLLCVLDRLDDGKQKNDFITYYLNVVFTLNPKDSPINPR